MRSALARKAWADLRRRRARTALSVITLALAVGSVGLFAVPNLMDRAMQHEVAAGRLADLSVETRPLPLDAAQLAALRQLPNVAALEPESFFATRVLIGQRRATAYLIGVPDYANQPLNVIHRSSGTNPGPGEVLTDAQNARQGRYGGRAGSVVRALASDGHWRPLRVSGEGRSLNGAQLASNDKAIILYATPATIAAFSGQPGYSSLAFRLRDRSPAAVVQTMRDVDGRLRAGVPQFTGFSELPSVRAPGDWPGKEGFDNFSSFFLIVTFLALLSALVLIANTMTTLIGEQTAEIAAMKAIGGRRRQIAGIYLRTAAILGGLGAVIGLPLGVLVANLLVGFLAGSFYGIHTGIGVDPPILVASALLAVLGTMLAAAPAIRRGLRLPIREGLESVGVQPSAGGALDRMLRRVGFVPRVAQIGLRGAARRKRRSLATVVIVAVAVGNLLAVMAVGKSVTNITRAGWSDRDWQIQVGSNLRRPLDARAESLIRSTPGVASAEPEIMTSVTADGQDALLYGVRQRTAFRYHMVAGRWYTPAEQHDGALVAVVERNIARTRGIHVGDVVPVSTATGVPRLRVIGIASNQQENGTVLFVPLSTTRALLHSPGGVNHYWIRTTSPDHAFIDATTSRLEDVLTSHGYEVGTEITYVGERDNVAENRTIILTLAVLGFLVVAISLVGLVNAITMSVIERTREIGILRSIGARARDVRRIFGTEGAALAVAGWALGVPLGWALDRLLVWLVREIVHVEIPATYPVTYVMIALGGTLALALLAMAPPLHRASRFRPGEALRYA